MNKLHITINKDTKLFFTSDLHLHHGNIVSFQNRPFVDAKEMGKKLIENWNSVVGEDDHIFCLGDFDWFPSRHQVKKIINKLNGNIYMLLGNHDKKEAFELCESNPKFHLCDDIVHIYVEDEENRLPWKIFEVVCCHYPMATWSHVRHSIQLFGHIHSTGDKEYCEFGKSLGLRPNQLDVGVDAHEYRPIDIFEIVKLIKKNGYDFSKVSPGKKPGEEVEVDEPLWIQLKKFIQKYYFKIGL